MSSKVSSRTVKTDWWVESCSDTSGQMRFEMTSPMWFQSVLQKSDHNVVCDGSDDKSTKELQKTIQFNTNGLNWIKRILVGSLNKALQARQVLIFSHLKDRN